MSITSANAVIILNLPGVFSSPQQIQQFSADDIFGIEEIEAAETAMGVDGTLTGGFINVPTPQTITLMADSPSGFFFDQWFAQQKAQQDTFTASGTVTLRSIGTKFTMVNGFLRRYKPAPDAKKTLQARRFTIEWQSALPSATS
jgi:hypothetical protein